MSSPPPIIKTLSHLTTLQKARLAQPPPPPPHPNPDLTSLQDMQQHVESVLGNWTLLRQVAEKELGGEGVEVDYRVHGELKSLMGALLNSLESHPKNKKTLHSAFETAQTCIKDLEPWVRSLETNIQGVETVVKGVEACRNG
ncbi:uncharacterized protein SPPG_01284 [Spizellomyces punctatus DAOM BR117]|uniref:Uncharacterized protein n=1 Tax=Spizellomyces punctatus (strain DAOM BR117) TaxID=645134 RepID=A0A0L0HRS5_SPIPD|nr:uncharacterized protein SPPG_01284 [Spizellomyces punctatus DAOM BR117]KND03828.1 hypothetical protein SPPG_01284 [Spizellomyces punctatus DAOM BR117]|eukprot:XP_016611867.1 hypothetical protein SPPG_01284 [Spizellomyces punctatus DAOM BR117]